MALAGRWLLEDRPEVSQLEVPLQQREVPHVLAPHLVVPDVLAANRAVLDLATVDRAGRDAMDVPPRAMNTATVAITLA